MDLGDLRALVLTTNLATHGIPVTVTRPFPDDTPIVTRGIWMTDTTGGVPGSLDFQRREPTRVMVLSRAAVPTVPRGTRIVAPENPGGEDATWRVDAIERIEADHVRVMVIPAPEP
jgi:hypothetical protein